MPLRPCTVSPKQSLALPRHVVRKSSVGCARPPPPSASPRPGRPRVGVGLARPSLPAVRWARQLPAAPAPGGGAPVESPPHAKAALSLNNLGRRRAGRARGNGHGGGVRRRAWTHRGEEGTGACPRPTSDAPTGTCAWPRRAGTRRACDLFQVTRKIIRRYVSSDGTEKEEVTLQGQPQEPVSVEDGDGYSRVVKRVVLRSDTEQSEVRPPGAPGPAPGACPGARRARRSCSGITVAPLVARSLLWHFKVTVGDICSRYTHYLWFFYFCFFLNAKLTAAETQNSSPNGRARHLLASRGLEPGRARMPAGARGH